MEIWKYTLEITDVNAIQMRKNAKILKIDSQFNEPRIWALVDPLEELELRTFRTIGTGHEISKEECSSMEYVDSFMIHGGSLVFHVFELNKI